jgi:hypothetical protein
VYRLTPLFCIALLWLAAPAHAKDKPKPLEISACYGKICIHHLRWRRPSSFEGTDRPNIEGVLGSGTAATLQSISVSFALKSADVLVGTAPAYLFADIPPPGGAWAFKASFSQMIAGTYVTRIESVTLDCSIKRNGQTGPLVQTLKFDPLFDDRGSIKRWEKIHGKRER